MSRPPDGRLARVRSFAMRALGLTVYRRLEWYEREFGRDLPHRTATLGWVGIRPLHRNFRWSRTTN